ncbi:hypothetical protein [Actinomadura rugatobispora]|uniref:Uncharacterized protein n=1 Tax=Actinomadura rugatobispora TaxID=1994 RepID=A0ABW0ZZ51_9ACTN|nr:hypothetical protein GCM10010200_037710 [Actinomadura rugatobispora]
MGRAQGRAAMVRLTVDGRDAGLVHRSVLERVAEIAGRLGCRAAVALGLPPVSYDGAGLARLRRDLDQVIAFADASRRTGWELGDLAVAPGERPVPVLDTPQGVLWADALRGFELRGTGGAARRVTELAEPPGTARRTPLTRLIEPLAEAAGRARVLEVREQGHDEGAGRQG